MEQPNEASHTAEIDRLRDEHAAEIRGLRLRDLEHQKRIIQLESDLAASEKSYAWAMGLYEVWYRRAIESERLRHEEGELDP